MGYLGNAPARSFISFERQVFTIVNSQTAYTLSHSVTNENDIRLVINNIVQEPGSGKAYTASGTTLTLSAALTNGTDEMYCVFLGRAVGTVNAPAGSVTSAMLNLTSAVGIGESSPGTLLDIKGPAGANNRITLNSSDAGSNAQVLGGIVVENQGDSVVQISGRRESATDDGYFAIETQATGGSLTERVRVHSGGVMSAANGIALGVGTANTASNVLDDYEEGTWTPSVGGGSVNIDHAIYRKIGSMVFCQFVIKDETMSSMSTAVISGLPFTSVHRATTSAVAHYNLFGYDDIVGQIEENETNLTMLHVRANNSWQAANFTNGSNRYLTFTITYQTS